MDASLQAARFAVFAEVAEAGSYAEAARRLGLTRSAVSQRVHVLEAELSLRLFNRTTRSLALTEAGRALLPHCQTVSAAADAAVAAMRAHREQPTGTLVITAAKGPAHAVVAPLLPALLADYAALDVELRVQEHNVDLVAEGVDVAIRAGRVDTAHRGRRLAPLRLRVCGAPAYFAAMGEPSTVAQLAFHRWLAFAPMGDHLTIAGERIALRPRLRVDDGEVLRRMLVAGVGLGVLPTFYIGEGLRSVLPPIDAGSLWAVHPYERQPPPKVRVLLDRLVRAASR